MKVRIQAIEASKKLILDFAGPTITLGRDAGCDLPMPGTTNVSGRHAQITLAPDGASLIDLESTNGTYLNDRRIEGRKRLRQGDYLRLGQTGPCFQIVELDLARVQPAPAIAGTAREEGANRDEKPEYSAPPPRPPIAKGRPTSAPQAPGPVTAHKPATGAPGQTRLMVVQLQKKNRNLLIGVGLAVAALLLFGGVTGLYLRDLSSKTANLDEANKKLQERTEDIDQTVGKVSKSFVPAKKTSKDYFPIVAPSVALIENGNGTGSGSLVENRGSLFVVTNRHVIEGSVKGVAVGFWRPGHADKKEKVVIPPTKAKVVKIHRKVDLAIIDVSLGKDEIAGTNLVPLTLAPKSRSRAEGEYLFVIGHPGFGGGLLTHTLTDGKISAVRNHPDNNLLQITAAINPGNSGGPVFDDEGEIIGVATFIIRSNPNDKRNIPLEALNFALDVAHVHELLNEPSASFTTNEINAILQNGSKGKK